MTYAPVGYITLIVWSQRHPPELFWDRMIHLTHHLWPYFLYILLFDIIHMALLVTHLPFLIAINSKAHRILRLQPDELVGDPVCSYNESGDGIFFAMRTEGIQGDENRRIGELNKRMYWIWQSFFWPQSREAAWSTFQGLSEWGHSASCYLLLSIWAKQNTK